jgi:hypothetical protein
VRRQDSIKTDRIEPFATGLRLLDKLPYKACCLMFKHRTTQDPFDLLPWYANHTLSATERETIESSLETNPATASQLAVIEDVRSAVNAQPQLSPSPTVRRQLLTRLNAERQAPVRLGRSAWLVGSVVALVLLVALWMVVQPGIALRWSVNGGNVSAYRIYRAPVGTEEFRLLSEIHAQSDARSYSFIDITSLPGQTYTYIVEAVTQNGETSFSPLAVGRGWDVLPAQLALIMTSVVGGLATMMLMAHSTQVANRRLIGA